MWRHTEDIENKKAMQKISDICHTWACQIHTHTRCPSNTFIKIMTHERTIWPMFSKLQICFKVELLFLIATFIVVIHHHLILLRHAVSVNKPPSVIAVWLALYRHSKSPHWSSFTAFHSLWGNYFNCSLYLFLFFFHYLHRIFHMCCLYDEIKFCITRYRIIIIIII